ncbi:cytochrome c [uncultured Sulfitobacter sp.]|uniref:c-type cytochrome n=1 Tax=uncultured Sulfitobacter sp. TaxID=191468 RepID=UPI002615D012|nr:cytochrome c [uncultured Sulfitobacter sp.]
MNTLEKTLFVVTLGAGIVASTAFAASHADKAAMDAVKARHAQMQMVGYHIGVLGGIAKGEAPYDSAVVDAAANNLAALASMSHATLWVEGSEQGAVEGSRAKPEIWSDSAGFEAKFNDMKMAASALVGAADAAAVGAGMGALGGSCKGCHETYRGPKN